MYPAETNTPQSELPSSETRENELFRGAASIDELVPMPTSFEQEALQNGIGNVLAEPDIVSMPVKAEAPKTPEALDTDDRQILGAMGAVALAGDVAYSGAREGFKRAAENLRIGGRLILRSLGRGALALAGEAKYRTTNIFERAGQRSYRRHKSIHAIELNNHMLAAQDAEYSNNPLEANEHLSKIQQILDKGTNSRFGRVAERLDKHRRPLSAQASAEAQRYQDIVAETPRAIDWNLLDHAARAKALGNKREYASSVRELSKNVDHNRNLDAPGVDRQASFVERHLSEVKKAPIEEGLGGSWTKPKSILRLRLAIENEIRQKTDSKLTGPAKELKQRLLRQELTEKYLGDYFGVKNLDELKTSRSFSPKQQKSFFETFDLPLDDIRELAGEARKAPKRARKAA